MCLFDCSLFLLKENRENMLIEARYYDKAIKEIKAYEEAPDKRNQKKDSQLDTLIEMCEEQQREKKIIPNTEKISFFSTLQKASLELAKILEWNIVTVKDNDNTYGYIELSYGTSWVLSNSPQACKRTLAMLYESADQICTSVMDGQVVQKFEFELADQIVVNDEIL